MKRKFLTHGLGAILLIFFVAVGIRSVTNQKENFQLKDIKLQSKSAELKELEIEYKQLNTQLDHELRQKNVNKEKAEELKKHRDELQRELDEAERELQARAEARRVAQERLNKAAESGLNAFTGTQTVSAATNVSGGCNTGNRYKDFIYTKESSCNPAAVNSIGCRGIGQACPGSKLPCGADFACQDKWFSDYAVQRYGSWEAAYNFWLQNHWW